MNNSFNERIKQEAIKYSKLYKSNFLDYEYLICSEAFTQKDYYIIKSHADNYEHLLGVHSLISPQEFFDKCYNGTLSTDDFDFIKKNQTEKDVKGSVRRKIKVLSNALNIFNNDSILTEEGFVKNKIFCSFATSDNTCTFGFITGKYSYPKTLLKYNELDLKKAKNVDLILRKKKAEKYFEELILGDETYIKLYYSKIKHLLSPKII